MSTEVQPVKYVREITLAILQTYIKNKIDIEIIQGIMINFDDRHFRKGDYHRRQSNRNDLEDSWAACTKAYIFPNSNSDSKHLVGQKGSRIKELTECLNQEFPELRPWYFDVIRNPLFPPGDFQSLEESKGKIESMVNGTHEMSQHYAEKFDEKKLSELMGVWSDELERLNQELDELHLKEKNFFADFREIRMELL